MRDERDREAERTERRRLIGHPLKAPRETEKREGQSAPASQSPSPRPGPACADSPPMLAAA